MRVRFTILFALLFAGWLWLDARAQTGGPHRQQRHRFEKVTDGVCARHRVIALLEGCRRTPVGERFDLASRPKILSPAPPC